MVGNKRMHCLENSELKIKDRFEMQPSGLQKSPSGVSRIESQTITPSLRQVDMSFPEHRKH
jgi:hypothetical protein